MRSEWEMEREKGLQTSKEDYGTGFWTPDTVHYGLDIEVVMGEGHIAVVFLEEIGFGLWLLWNRWFGVHGCACVCVSMRLSDCSRTVINM